jgi:hypothetical protein
MDRAALARELFELHAQMRTEIWALKLEAGLAANDLPGRTAAACAKLAGLVERVEDVVGGYVASMDSGAFTGSPRSDR